MVMNNPLEQKLEHIISRMQADASVDAPADSLKYVSDLFRTRAAAARPSLARRIVAALTMDLMPDRAAFGERSAAGGQARQMLFDAGEFAIDLRVTRCAKGFDVRGQVLGDIGRCSVTLSNGGISAAADADAEGAFRFDDVTAGTYTIVITGENGELVVENIDLV